MKIHEYQAKALLARYRVPVPRGEVARTVEEADAAARKIGGSVVVKAQIHAGGRGKGGRRQDPSGRCRCFDRSDSHRDVLRSSLRSRRKSGPLCPRGPTQFS